MNGTGGDDPYMMAIRDCIKNVYEKEMKKMVGEYEICSCRVMVRLKCGLIPAIPMILNGYMRRCPWCGKVNPAWVERQRTGTEVAWRTAYEFAHTEVEQEKKAVKEKVEAAVKPVEEPGKRAEETEPRRKVWVVVRILRGLENVSDICVFDTEEKAEDFRRALSMTDTYDCVTRMFEREVIE